MHQRAYTWGIRARYPVYIRTPCLRSFCDESTKEIMVRKAHAFEGHFKACIGEVLYKVPIYFFDVHHVKSLRSDLLFRVQPFEFVVGQPVSSVGVKKINDSANGLFSGQAGVKPPPALSTAVVGMKLGGKVSNFWVISLSWLYPGCSSMFNLQKIDFNWRKFVNSLLHHNRHSLCSRFRVSTQDWQDIVQDWQISSVDLFLICRIGIYSIYKFNPGWTTVVCICMLTCLTLSSSHDVVK